MSKPNVISIDGVNYVREDAQIKSDKDIKICVLDRGFVYIGNTEIKDDFLIITYAHNIRVWGTTKGLGELVNGPLNNTKLDKVGIVRVPVKALISLIDVQEGKWNLL